MSENSSSLREWMKNSVVFRQYYRLQKDLTKEGLLFRSRQVEILSPAFRIVCPRGIPHGNVTC